MANLNNGVKKKSTPKPIKLTDKHIPFLSELKYMVIVNIAGHPPLPLEGTIKQIVLATTEENASKAVEEDFLRAHPDGTIMQNKIFKTIVGE